ncbi:crossover junction endonuclease MUS81 isoform X2 [Diachasmimorpha longicaudata]|uniref:crossover junction endonuclease MUS81 isoform X2 n=1 Tax=Diachasmimorpha longicaudata TaxID=58733 RepID=UPI0030B8D9C8
MKRIKATRIRPNKLFESWLEEWRDEASLRSSGLQDHFSKALEALRKYPLTLESEMIINSQSKTQQGQNGKSTVMKISDDELPINEPCRSKKARVTALDNDGSTTDDSSSSKNSRVILSDDECMMNDPGCSKNFRIPPVDDQPVMGIPNYEEKDEEEDEPETLVRSTFTLLPGCFDIILLVDIQEVKGKDKDDPVITQLTRENISFEIRRLTVGDYLWIARCHSTKQELVLPYIVERKRVDDLASSIKDGRYHEQKFRLKEAGIPNIVYLIEKLPNEPINTLLPVTTLSQAAVNAVVQDGFSIRHAENHRDSMLYLATFTKILIKLFKDKWLIECDRNSPQKRIDVKSERISLMEFKTFNQSSTKAQMLKVKDVFIKQLIQIRGLSLNAVLAIVKAYPSPLVLKKAFEDAGNNGETLLATIEFGETKRKLGPVLAKIIYQLYSSEDLR